jgi:hypothetical protein
MKEFNSSFDTIEEANQRVEYVFYFETTWGAHYDDVYANVDKTTQKGFRRLETGHDDSGTWTVSVAPSEVFDHLDK